MTNDNLQSKIVATCMFSFILILTMIFVAGNYALHKHNQRLQSELNYYHDTYLRKDGWTSLWSGATNGVRYDIRSFDTGKTWYATHTTINDCLIIDGEANKVYPGLMKTLQDWDNIISYAEKNGPINLTNESSLLFLKENGLTIKRNTN